MKWIYFYTVTFAAFATFALIIPSASAHVTGSSWETPVGKYTTDIGYDPTVITAGQYELFNFYLWIGTTTTDQNGITSGTPQDFAQVWIRIVRTSDQDTVLATGIWKQPIGPTTLLFEFDEPGDYSLEISFRDADGNDIAVVSEPITVESSGSSPALQYGTLGLLVGVFLGVGSTMYINLRKRKRST